MQLRNLSISDLLVNRANDRHGELENETAAIAWLFNAREAHMKNLAKDLTCEGTVYEPPLVSSEGSKYLVFDGNRRVTCLKLLHEPKRAPTTELQNFFEGLRSGWNGKMPEKILCQVENDRDRVDSILFRRHTGTQNGVGQSNWDDRMKSNFVARTGQGGGINVADEVEARLSEAGLLPARKKIPRSTMNRLLSAEPYRNRVGFSVRKRKFEYTHQEDVVLGALARIANDLATGQLVLGQIWDVDGKRGYLNKLEKEGILPTAEHALAKPKAGTPKGNPPKPKPKPSPSPSARTTLIPQLEFGLEWPGRLQRHHQIWDELQFRLELSQHPNAISALFRVLLELSIENCIQQKKINIQQNDKLSIRALRAAEKLNADGKIDNKQLGVIKKFQNLDQLVSADTLNRYVHSPNFAPSPEHLMSLWDTLADFIVECLKA